MDTEKATKQIKRVLKTKEFRKIVENEICYWTDDKIRRTRVFSELKECGLLDVDSFIIRFIEILDGKSSLRPGVFNYVSAVGVNAASDALCEIYRKENQNK